MTTPAEQEAERRYPVVTYDLPPYADMFSTMARRHFVEGVEWSESRYRELLGVDPYIAFASGCEWAWAHPPAHIRELLEAAREYRGNSSAQLEADELGLVGPATCAEDEIIGRLLAAAAALEE